MFPPHNAKQPLHRRILGRGAAELDTIDDLRLELEHAHKHSLIEYQDYLDCHSALDIREQRAKKALNKAVGRCSDNGHRVGKGSRETASKEPWKPWKIKILIVLFVLVYLKINSFGVNH